MTPRASSVDRNTISGVNLNLGTIGRIQSHQASSLTPGRSSFQDEFAVLTHAHAGLPRPGLDIECTVLTSLDCPNLLVLAARRHSVAYYVIANAAERSARATLAGALACHRLQIILLADSSEPMWSSFYFEDAVLGRLQRELDSRKDAWRTADDAWRDQLGKLVLDLPAMFAQAEPDAGRCTQHAAILASGNRATFERQLERCIEAGRRRTAN